MAIIGIHSLVYGVENLSRATKFFEDFGLNCVLRQKELSQFLLPEGSTVVLRPLGHAALPRASKVAGPGVQEIVWGVDNLDSLECLVAELTEDHDIERDGNGAAHFVPNFGVPMALREFRRTPVVCAPDPLNAPGHVRRLNQHRKWRRRARPKTIQHVVFQVRDYLSAAAFMRERLRFRLSDSQRGFGEYLRAEGAISHHNFLLLNANAPVPGMDGALRFHHANFGVEDIDEIMAGANHMSRAGWENSREGLGRHRVDSALFYYLPCPAGGEAEYGADGDCVDDGWVPRDWDSPLFAYAQFVHNLPTYLRKEPEWTFNYLVDEGVEAVSAP